MEKIPCKTTFWRNNYAFIMVCVCWVGSVSPLQDEYNPLYSHCKWTQWQLPWQQMQLYHMLTLGISKILPENTNCFNSITVWYYCSQISAAVPDI